MNRSTIYTVDANGALNAMQPSAPRDEDFMQDLVARYPRVISDQDGALLLIRREQPISDREDGGGRWSLDHLFVTRTGIPVLVELKRAKDTRLRREVVGQMLDYAANGTAYWKAGKVAESFAATVVAHNGDPEVVLAEFLGDASDPGSFWEQVDANFSAGRIKMVFVADEIPAELARIIEFLNEQMRADVRGVELTWFESDDGVTALAPRVIGETERAQTAKAARSELEPVSREEWIEQSLSAFGTNTVNAAYAYIDLVADAGGHAEVTRQQGSMIAVFDTPVGTLYPITFSKYGRGSVQLCLNYLAGRPAFASEEVRQDLLDRLSAIVGPLSTKTLNGFPAFPSIKLGDPDIRAKIIEFLRDVVAIAEG